MNVHNIIGWVNLHTQFKDAWITQYYIFCTRFEIKEKQFKKLRTTDFLENAKIILFIPTKNFAFEVDYKF